VSVDLVYALGPENPALLDSAIGPFFLFATGGGFFLPPWTHDRFWEIKSRRTLIEGVDNVTMRLTAYLRPRWLWSQKLQWDKEMDDSPYTQAIWDDTKRAVVDTAPWLLWLTIGVTIARFVLTVMAIKEDLSWWSSLTEVRAVSLLSLIGKAVSEIVVVLFLRDESASAMVWAAHAAWAAVYLWKISKLFRPIQKWPYFGLKSEYRQEMGIDFQGLGILGLATLPLVAGYAVWILISKKFRSLYSYFVRVAVAAVYAFGFLLMLPQLYMNWKLKTVEGMSGVALAYKTVNTFIDDLFAFVMTMPTLHRIACFRDDIVFFVWLWQRHIYPADSTRGAGDGRTDGGRESQGASSKQRKKKELEDDEESRETEQTAGDEQEGAAKQRSKTMPYGDGETDGRGGGGKAAKEKID
jgi:hypothetical protein